MGARFDPGAHIAQVGITEEESAVWALRRQGFSVEAIGQELGIPRATAYRRLDAARKAFIADTRGSVEEWRAEQIAQIEDVIRTQNAVRQYAVQTDEDTGKIRVDVKALAAADALILRANEAKAKLLGTNAVERVDVTATITHVDAKDAELASMLDALGPATREDQHA